MLLLIPLLFLYICILDKNTYYCGLRKDKKTYGKFKGISFIFSNSLLGELMGSFF